ncbi:hypothetical protein P5706_08525 [Pseudomonas sp. ChxA]|uniref:hypothetical protein n=1 Tax=Pseudomonas sp. ChxA TaxID=3035473 RepID=UPI002553C2C8|nr:hypothetical protein [Pseudomonas sp. ChxA]MDL2184229.1 hypothetical protein [Pseudomonas sp. ChxA]
MNISSTLPTYNASAPSAVDAQYARATLREMSTVYANMDRYELGKLLGNQFERFEDPENRGFLTVEFLGYIAMGMAGNKFTSADQVLALEVLKRGGFTASIDMDDKGERDGKFDRQDIRAYMDVLLREHEETTAGAEAR